LKEPTVPVCDYEGSRYRTEFWEGQGRDYEDLTERVALRALLPPRGKRIAHLGAGFGRMTGELGGYDQVIVLDYSRTMLREAQAHLGRKMPRAVLCARALFDTWVLPGYNGPIILTGGEPMRYNLCRLFGVCSASFVR